jgi:phosphoesterase RecJ-like protein
LDELDFVRELERAIETNNDFLLLAHKSADGDSIGSMLALAHYLHFQRGKNVAMPFPIEYPYRYRFLQAHRDILPHFDYDSSSVFILVDTSHFERIDFGTITPSRNIDFVIDHHSGETDICGRIWRAPEVPAVGLMIYRILKHLNAKITLPMAEAIYTAILTDTGQFAFSGTTPECFKTAGQLLDCGADPWHIALHLYWMQPQIHMLNMKTALNAMQYHFNGKLTIIPLSRNNVENEQQLHETEGVIDLGIMIDGVLVTALIREVEENTQRVSMRSRKGIDVSIVARKYGGGGRINASGFTLYMSLQDAVDTIRSEFIEIERLIHSEQHNLDRIEESNLKSKFDNHPAHATLDSQ